jgi:ATP-dependent Lhr-like helicase
MPLSHFHPAIARWFGERFGAPTQAQAEGWAAIKEGRHTLIAAPTGSGKTLAAFLSALDELLREGLEGPLPDETRVIYVSPLKALSADIHRNLAEPRREIRRVAEEMGYPPVKITAAVRTGDTPASERAAMLRTPPHILVTTPESLYLLLTAERSRKLLSTVRTVIVDEIHALLDSRRGAHLALSLERLEHVAGRPLQRIGLSATQRPIEEVAGWLVGDGERNAPAVIDHGHRRAMDLAIELPGSPLEAVMSTEVWTEVYTRLADLIEQHRTTLVFVNTRRLAERVARHLAERLGETAVTAHHGSLSKDVRLDAEERLKSGGLRALVATASLELGIDIGHVDLVCQLGSPRRISTFLQRVGRSGHTIVGTPKGRLFPLTRDDLVECAALLRVVKAGELDRVEVYPEPLDVLAQQVVAEAAAEDWSVDDLFARLRRAYPYRRLTRETFDEVLKMASDGFSTRRGRRGALVHYDGVNGRVRGRKGARLLALTSGGAIPDNADYRVVLEPEETFIGSVNEDFAIESQAGDVFQLGNASWRILRIQTGVVRVEDARGQPPNIPFWLGEAPERSAELSAAVAVLRHDLEPRLEDSQAAIAWLVEELGLERAAAFQIVTYLGEAKRLLGALPTQQTLVAERFFDESGGMQLVIHSPFGSRLNRAWGLALRKRFCRTFNFELQAAATEEGLLLSLGPQHSFPLENVFRFLNPDSTRDILVQALLDAPMFGTRWRWNASIALAIPRQRGGRKVVPQIQRMEADDLLAAVFPDAAACLENIAGDREVPDHPLARQTIADCLHEAMDLDRLLGLLRGIQAGEINCVVRDLPEPSPLAHEILTAKPYAFLDDAPLEERRTQAVQTRRAFEPSTADDLGRLDPEAIVRVREEAWPDPENADELHDALLVSGYLTEAEGVRGREGRSWLPWFEELESAGRSGQTGRSDDEESEPPTQSALGTRQSAIPVLWFATERRREIEALNDPANPDRPLAIRDLLRGRLELVGPTTAAALAESLGVTTIDADIALAALEGEGIVLRGQFTPGATQLEWCERRLLARIHRYTLNRLRAEIEPVSPADLMRFLFVWQHVEPEHRVAGLEGLAAVIEQLDGFELPAGAWEKEVLPTRCEEYDPVLLDTLCLTGRVAWGKGERGNGERDRQGPGSRDQGPGVEVPGAVIPSAARNLGPPLTDGRHRLTRPSRGPLRSTPIALFRREHADLWCQGSSAVEVETLSEYARAVQAVLQRRGASFFQELVAGSGLLASQVETALGELAGLGLVSSDSFAGLRALLVPSSERKPLVPATRRRRTAAVGIESAGRWAIPGAHAEPPAGADLERIAWAYLRRYGVVLKQVLAREADPPPWRDLLLVYRRLEARGEIRGGRFVAGLSGEQFALPEAVGQLRAVRRREKAGTLISLSAADPLNLTGLVTPGERIPAITSNRVLYEDGVPLAAIEAGTARSLATYDQARAPEIERALVRRRVSPALGR